VEDSVEGTLTGFDQQVKPAQQWREGRRERWQRCKVRMKASFLVVVWAFGKSSLAIVMVSRPLGLRLYITPVYRIILITIHPPDHLDFENFPVPVNI
jgi:hypothetical protein